MADDDFGLTNSRLDGIVRAAENKLRIAIFGKEKPPEGPGPNRFLNSKDLEKLYRDELGVNTVSKNLSEMQQSVRRMTSSFLPVDFFLDQTFGALSASIEEQVAETESYENAFMRMLGMPQSTVLELSETIVTVSESGSVNKETSYEEVELNILDQRQLVRPERSIVINNNMYDLDAITDLPIEEQRAVNEALTLLDLEAGEDVEADTRKPLVSARIDNISDDLFKFSYLLLPPVQDVRISGCINEPDKIVAPLFSNTVGRVINRRILRPSLLETIIRIRLDRLSGTSDVARTPGEEQDSGGTKISVPIGKGGDEEEENEATPDSFGVLESLFILRLRSALAGLAQDLRENIDNVIKEMLRTRRRPATLSTSSRAGGHNTGEHDGAATDEVEIPDSDKNSTSNKQRSFRNQKTIEDSIMALLGDNSEVLSLQSQTQRNSTIRDAHLMSGLISIIDLPRKRIDKDLSELEKKIKDASKKRVGPLRSEINSTLGVDIGIGTLDMIVFSLALFTISEDGLLGLLTDKEYENLKNSNITSSLLPGTGDKIPTVDAIQELSELIISGYNTFKAELEQELVDTSTSS